MIIEKYMESTEIEIGTRKLQKVGGAHQITVPKLAVTMLRLETGDVLKWFLDGDALIIRK